MMTKQVYILLLAVLAKFDQSSSSNAEWELKQFQNIENTASSKFDSIEGVIEDAQTVTRNFIEQQIIPGLVIGVSIKGKTLWTEGFGQIDIENDVTTHNDSVYRLASISKPLSAALVGQLIERGLLDLNASIHEYISEELFPKKTLNGESVNITVRQVLSHTAGLRLTELNDFDIILDVHNVSQTIPVFSEEKLLFKPGTEFSYSNYGFQMVGALIEAVLKNSFQSEIKKFFESLGMKSSYAETRGQIIKHRPRYYTRHGADSYYLRNADLFDDLLSNQGWWPAGGCVSNVEDLLIFGNAMLSASKGEKKDFLSKSMVEELWTPETIGLPKAQDFGTNEYGMGWFIQHVSESNPYPYKTLIWHSGGLLGTSTMLLLLPDQDIVGVAFANRGAAVGLDQLLLYVAQNLKDFIK